MEGSSARSGFEVIFEAEATNRAKFRNDVTVRLLGPHAVTYELPTDEGGIHGGDGSAPYPLAYFTSALTACIMTQIRAFSKRLNIEVRGFSVNTRCHWRAEQHGRDPYHSAPVGFTMDIDIDADVDDLRKRQLVEAAQKGCFVEQSLRPGIVKHRLKTAAGWMDA